MLPLVSQADVLPLAELPSLANILMLDAVVAKVQVALDDTFTKAMVRIISAIVLTLYTINWYQPVYRNNPGD